MPLILHANKTMVPVIKIEDKIKEISGRSYFPIDVARVNNQVVRIALYKGEYHWHKHTNEDELFYVIRGKVTIQMKPPHSNITLKEGEMAVIPNGIEHCPISEENTYVLMFEPFTLQIRGD